MPNGGDLQQALNVAQPGDVILLEAGAVYQGPFTLPRKTGDGWIAVVSSRVLELAAGQRVLPSDASKMAVLEGGEPSVLQTEPGAHHYRFVGLEMRPSANTFMFNIVDVGSDARTTDDIPHHVIFDRCYLHGDSAQGARRAVAMNGAHIAVIDSYLSDLKEVDNDSQAIDGWSGPGPYKIDEQLPRGAGENVMFGGEDPWLEGLVPSDIEIRANDIARPWSWWHHHPDYDGRGWTIKNLLELKNARRVLIQGNRFARNWADGQQGFAIVLTPRNQEGTAPWSRVEDVSFIDNELHEIDSGVNIAAFDDRNPEVTLARVLIRNNLFTGVGMTPGTGAGLPAARRAAGRHDRGQHGRSRLFAQHVRDVRSAAAGAWVGGPQQRPVVRSVRDVRQRCGVRHRRARGLRSRCDLRRQRGVRVRP